MRSFSLSEQGGLARMSQAAEESLQLLSRSKLIKTSQDKGVCER